MSYKALLNKLNIMVAGTFSKKKKGHSLPLTWKEIFDDNVNTSNRNFKTAIISKMF